MTLRRPAALKPWTQAWAGPLALSIAVHGAVLGAALGLGGLVEPPRPEAVVPVELVFAVAPAAGPATAVSAPSRPLEPPAQEEPVRTAAPVVPKPAPTTLVALPPLPKPKPSPPAVPILASAPPKLTDAEVRAADDAIAGMLNDAAAKAQAVSHNSHNATDVVSPPTLSPGSSPGRALPHKGGGDRVGPSRFSSPSPLTREGRGGGGDETPSEPETQSASRSSPPAALVPPGWTIAGLANAPPVYPLAARRSGAEGRVVLRVRVSAGGAVETVTVATSSGHALLDEAARRAVAGWRFVPGRLAGMAVAASVDVPVVFRLRD